MAVLQQEGDLALMFQRNDSIAQELLLNNVETTGKILGTGSYGNVEEVLYCHAVCAGKKLHVELVHTDNEGLEELVDKYRRECTLMAALRHPNITQFLGLCFLPSSPLPVLVMERMEMSLDDLLTVRQLPLSLKLSILSDVARGLVYLHSKEIIHRDLTSKNVLLTASLVGKITDLGNSRLVDMEQNQTLTACPGTAVYMPPEATDGAHRYSTSLDIFSFGHLALYVFIQIFPKDLRPKTYPNPDNWREVIGLTELERRREYISRLEALIGRISTEAVDLVKGCLHNEPTQRPSALQCLERLTEIFKELEEKYSSVFGRVDIARINLEREIVAKDLRIQVLERLKDRVIQEKDEQVRDITRQRDDVTRELQEKTRALERGEERMGIMEEELDSLHRQNSALQQDLEQATARKEEVTQQLEDKMEAYDKTWEELQQCIRCQNDLLQDMEDVTRSCDNTKEELEQVRRDKDHVSSQYLRAASLLQERTTKLEETTAELVETEAALETKRKELKEAHQSLEAKETDLQDVLLQLVRHDVDTSRGSLSDRSFTEADGTHDKIQKQNCSHVEEVLSEERSRPITLVDAVNLADWHSCTDLPMEVEGYVQCVVIKGVLYLGGGWTSSKIMRFHNNCWRKLQQCNRSSFAIATLKEQLILVGGKHKSKNKSLPRQVKVWNEQQDSWMEECYPDMSQGRYDCSAVSHGGVLAVAGGWTKADSVELLDSISLLDTDSFDCSWRSARVKLTVCCHSMRSVVVEGYWYLMGGSTQMRSAKECSPKETDIVLCVCLSKFEKKDSSVKVIEGLNYVSSTPMAYGGCLYAVGGKSKDDDLASCQIMRLDGGDCSSTWVTVGQLPQGAWNYVCAVTDAGLIVTGGELGDDEGCSTNTYLAKFV